MSVVVSELLLVMTTTAASISSIITTATNNNDNSSNTTNCSWAVLEEEFDENNTFTGYQSICLSDMLVYSDAMWGVAGLFCWTAVAVACWNMYRHFDTYSEPRFQVG